jgi:isoleucyl-tRNA synthetase
VVTDRIRLMLDGGDAVVDAVRVHEDHVAGQVLATEVVYGPVEDDSVGAVVVTLEGAELRFRFSVT